MKKVLILQSSARLKANTAKLAQEFARGAEEAGNQVETVNVARLNIHGCMGCGACRKNNQCVQKDDMQELYTKIVEADVIALATPVYFYEMNAQMKLVIDRTFALHGALHDKTFYLITTGAAPVDSYYEWIITAYHKYLSCFENLTDGGVILGGGTAGPHDIDKQPEKLANAYEKGKAV